VLVGLEMLSRLNSLPSLLARYDTTQSWGNFIGTIALGFVAAIPVTLIVFGLWLALGAIRRRVGIPMLAGEPSASASKDMLIAGLGLAGLFFAMTQPASLVPRAGMPATPTTTLDAALPLFAGIPDIPTTVLMSVALIGIPVLVVAALTPRWSLRVLMSTAIVALIGAMAWTAAPADDVDPLMVTLVIAILAVVAIAVVVWGSLAAWSWIVAALAYQALVGLRTAAYAPVWQERGRGALTLLVASALIALIARRTARPPGNLTRI